MPLKILGVIAGFTGVAMIVFTFFAWREMRGASTSSLAPSANSMPLTRFVCPELFATGSSGAKIVRPAELVQAASNRIYIIGGASVALIVVGIVLVVMPGDTKRTKTVDGGYESHSG
jgi:hypothetical protein